MLSVLFLGFLVGLQHAFEADHLAAVASLTTRSRGALAAARHGAVWGLGHTFTLFVFGGAVLLSESLVPERLAAALETGVGLMLVLLGADVLRRLLRERVHFHAHRHGVQRHFHAHSHAPHSDHASDPHEHRHPERLPLRALLVGMMHGMAGSAALIVLALGAVQSVAQGLLYIAVFGLGSIVGMALLGLVIALPLRWSARSLTWTHNGLRGLIGVFTLGLGALIVYRTAIAGGLWF